MLGGGLWWRVLALAAVLGTLSLAAGHVAGAQGPASRSAVLLALGAGQLGVAMGARTRDPTDGSSRNVMLPLSVLLAAALLVGAVPLPPPQALLGTAPVPAVAWWLTFAVFAAGSGAARLATGRPT